MSGRPGPRTPITVARHIIHLLHEHNDWRDIFPVADAVDQAVRQNA